MTEQEKNRPRESSDWRGLMEKNPGGDLLLRDLSSHFRVRNGTGWDHCALATGLQGEEVIFSSSCLPGSPAFLGASE